LCITCDLQLALKVLGQEGDKEARLLGEWRARPVDNLLAELKAQPKVRLAYFNYG
jgi:hypothetical protein